jgi:hypothetical protein
MTKNWFTLIPIAIILGMGCKGSLPDNTVLPKVGQGLSRIEGDVAIGRTAIKQAKPHTNDTGNSILVIGDSALEDAQKELVMAKTAFDAASKEIGKLEETLVVQREELKDLNSQFFSPTQKRLAKLILGGWLLLGLLGMVLKGATGGIGVWGFVGRNILRLLPFSNAFSFGANRITSYKGM